MLFGVIGGITGYHTAQILLLHYFFHHPSLLPFTPITYRRSPEV